MIKMGRKKTGKEEVEIHCNISNFDICRSHDMGNKQSFGVEQPSEKDNVIS